MGLWKKIQPEFWEKSDSHVELLNYRRMWRTALWLAGLVTLVPIMVLAGINFYQLDQQYKLQKNEIENHLERLATIGRVQISYFLEERRAALAYINQSNNFNQLSDPVKLETVFHWLRQSFGGFVDLGLIDTNGIQRAYAGPYNLQNRDYKSQDWYKEVQIRGIYVSDVFLGHRNFPHFVIAVRHVREGERPYVIRATIDTGRLNSLLRATDFKPDGELFLVNQEGVLQTPSRLFGGVLTKFPYLPGANSKWEGIFETRDGSGRPLLLNLSRIGGTPLTLVVANQPRVLLQKWDLLWINVLIMVGLSTIAILTVVWWGTSTLVSRIYEADRRRAAMLHQVEYTNKLASIGRLAAGVAHEINNPVAIINEKVGLMTDILAMDKEFSKRNKFLEQANVIKDSVRRVSEITHRLLGFARHLPLRSQEIHLQALIKEVLGFLGKEAEYRNIGISLEIPSDIPPLEADKGQLQQVLLNIINNALAVTNDGGRLTIGVTYPDPDHLAIAVTDTGTGIARENLNNIFEPFFSTKGDQGTGLGLSITYGIVRKMGGNIEVESQLGQGTTFTVILPRKAGLAEKDVQAS